ncbi:ATP-binding protein [uncultured Thiodictyon sp.]|jgi:anti-sigma regulatory factor (Ser/Thr protein kinase)|uniref:ATP-binding protein n=1 Tax=uncultured Thiodictyon sp. TaxID=1846217 RepID=UPI0025F53D18|nr:ATP-binding protein [uncultured Thiodictyon sp.]
MIRTNLQTFEVLASLEGVRELRRKVALGLGCTGLPEARQNETLVAVSELATNLVQHSEPPPRWIRVLLSRERGDWLLELADNGAPLLDWRARLTTGAIDAADCLAEDHGRGLPWSPPCSPTRATNRVSPPGSSIGGVWGLGRAAWWSR